MGGFCPVLKWEEFLTGGVDLLAPEDPQYKKESGKVSKDKNFETTRTAAPG